MKGGCRGFAVLGLLLGLAPALASASANTQYLFFQIFTYPGFGSPMQPMPQVMQTIVNTIGTVGTATQKLGFVAGPIGLDDTDAQTIAIIDQAFTTADIFNVAFMFHIDDSMFWKSRQDLWSQHQNVEWTSWSGTESGPRVVSWYTYAPLAPQMCYNSPGIEAAIATWVKTVVGPEIQKDLALLNAKGKGGLFAGVIVGWETQLPNATPTPGYCALTNLGYSAAKPPPSLQTVLPQVVNNFLLYWEQQFIAAGIPSSKLYTHLAVAPPGGDSDNAPLNIAFSSTATAGFSVYGTSTFAYAQIYQALQVKNVVHWGVSEGSNMFPPNAAPGGSGQPDEPMINFLAQAYLNCADYVNLFGWQDSGSPFQQALLDPSAIFAYRLFLTGTLGVPAACASP